MNFGFKGLEAGRLGCLSTFIRMNDARMSKRCQESKPVEGGKRSVNWRVKRCLQISGFIVTKRRKKNKMKRAVHSRQSV
jgi:hypothetical protein